ncbi:MAG: helix-turn-helix transcriptional regulator [Clostridia bacterium]|nr:helix-turn-helix transcriptional regulator [Clostridia bacterium]
MSIGEKIKLLRKSKYMTQEDLAECLNVSISAVSQWEIGKTMPDITLIPFICNVFDVSSDTLLEIDVTKKKQEIEKIREEGAKYYTRGFVSEGKKILKQGMARFPNSYEIMCDYVHVLELERASLSEEEAKINEEEIIKLGEKIVAECDDFSIRSTTIQKLCIIYSDIGNEKRAIELACKMPSYPLSRESLLEFVYNGEKLRDLATNTLLYNHVQALSNRIKWNFKMDSGEWLYTDDERAELVKKQIAFLKLIFEAEDYGFYNESLSDSYKALASHSARKRDANQSLLYIELSAHHAIKFIEYMSCKEFKFSSLLFKGRTEFPDVHLDSQYNSAYHLLNFLNEPQFDFLKDNAKFIQIKSTLEKHADKWQINN